MKQSKWEAQYAALVRFAYNQNEQVGLLVESYTLFIDGSEGYRAEKLAW